MHGDWLSNNEAITDEFSDCLARVGVGDLVYFVGVEPDLAFPTAYHRRGQAFLRGEVDPMKSRLVR